LLSGAASLYPTYNLLNFMTKSRKRTRHFRLSAISVS
jgi:hypothetical protein